MKENIESGEKHKFYGLTNKIVLPSQVTFLAPLYPFFPRKRFLFLDRTIQRDLFLFLCCKDSAVVKSYQWGQTGAQLH
jgi:hypothetical protein